MVQFLAGVLALITVCSSPVLALGLDQESLLLNGVALNDTYGSINDSEQVGDYLFLATGTSGVVIFDVSTPGQPVEINRLLDYGSTAKLARYQQYLYVTVNDPVLDRVVAVVDISDPMQPHYLHKLAYIDQTYTLDVVNGLLFASDWYDEIQIYDLSSPTQPTMLFSSSQYACSDIASQGDTVMVVHQGYLKALDVSDPANPILLDSVGFQGMTSSDVKVAWPDDYVYVCGRGRFLIFDASDPSDLDMIHEFGFDAISFDFDLAGNILYIAQGQPDQLVIYDISQAANPQFLASLDGPFFQLFLNRNEPATLYTSSAEGGRFLSMIDVSVPLQPVISYELGWNVDFADMKQVGDIFVLRDQYSGAWIVDWSNPAQALSTKLMSGRKIHDIEFTGELLFVTVYDHPDGPGFDGVYIYDMSDPLNPQYLHNIVLDAYPGLSYGNDALYVTTNDGKLVYDVSDPANPVFLGNLSLTHSWDYATRIVIEGNFLYRMYGSQSLYSYSITNPADPVTLGQIYLNLQNGSSTMQEFDIDNNRVAIGGWGNVNLVDVSDPANMVQTAAIDDPDVEYYYGAHISSDFLFTTSDPDGMIVYGIHNLNNPTERGSVHGVIESRRALAHDGEVYLLAGSNLWRFQTGLPPAPRNLSFDQISAAVTLTWQPPEYTEPMHLLGYHVYEDNDLIGNPADTTFTAIMTHNGTFEFTVTAVFNSGESDPAGPVVIDYEAASSIHLDPFDPYTTVPPPGGLVYFDVTLRNYLDVPQERDVWGWINLPNGNRIDLPVRTLSLDPNEVFTREWLSFQVPGTAAPGTYTVYGRIGHFPDLIDHQDTFTFTKLSSFR